MIRRLICRLFGHDWNPMPPEHPEYPGVYCSRCEPIQKGGARA